jgi:hypothetical protein
MFDNHTDFLQALKVHHAVLQAAKKAKKSLDIEVCEEFDNAVFMAAATAMCVTL